MSKTKIDGKCTANYTCIATIAMIILLLAGNIYLYRLHSEQKTIITTQGLYIKQLEAELENSKMHENKSESHFQKIFNHAWPNLRMPLWDTDDIIEGKNSSSYYSGMSTSTSDTQYVITTILPGFSKEDISVELDNNILKIDAKNNSLDKTKEHKQSIKIPSDADQDNIDIELNNGILQITIHRTKTQGTHEPKKLMIK
jgi:HSP20 family protein